MIIDVKVAINIIVLMIQAIFGFSKIRNYGLLLILPTLILFLILKEERFYDLALGQFLVFIIAWGVGKICSYCLQKKKLSDVDKSKIKDL